MQCDGMKKPDLKYVAPARGSSAKAKPGVFVLRLNREQPAGCEMKRLAKNALALGPRHGGGLSFSVPATTHGAHGRQRSRTQKSVLLLRKRSRAGSRTRCGRGGFRR